MFFVAGILAIAILVSLSASTCFCFQGAATKYLNILHLDLEFFPQRFNMTKVTVWLAKVLCKLITIKVNHFGKQVRIKQDTLTLQGSWKYCINDFNDEPIITIIIMLKKGLLNKENQKKATFL